MTVVRHGEAMPRRSVDKAARCFSVLQGQERIKPARGLPDIRIVVLIGPHLGANKRRRIYPGQGAPANPPAMGVVARESVSIAARGSDTG